MTDQTPIQGTAPALPTLSDAHYDSVMLVGIIEGAEILAEEVGGQQHRNAGNALAALFPELKRKAERLADDLERLEKELREPSNPTRAPAAAPAAPAPAPISDALRHARDETDGHMVEVMGLAQAADQLAFNHPALQGVDPDTAGLRATINALIRALGDAEAARDAEWKVACGAA